MRSKKYSEEEQLKIIEEAKSVGNVTAVARKYEVNESSIRNWMFKHKNKDKQDLISKVTKLEKILSDNNLENAILKELLKKTYQVWSEEDQLLVDLLKKDFKNKKF